ncbi:hypothetical protein GQ457_03G040620 [Hibiscus cannabinus]
MLTSDNMLEFHGGKLNTTDSKGDGDVRFQKGNETFCSSDLFGARESGRKFCNDRENRIPFCYLPLNSSFLLVIYSLPDPILTLWNFLLHFSTHFLPIFSSRNL